MLSRHKFVLFFYLSVCVNLGYAQDYISDEDFENQYEKPLTIDMDRINDVVVEIKKKKIKKNVFYGKKTRKGFTRTGFGGNVVTELFTMLRVYEKPLPYVRDIYWYNFGKRKIIQSRRIDKNNAGIMHGPYKKMIGNEVIEEGIFFMGTKHGRWTTWNKHNILQTKEKYYKGWPKESMVAYHNKKTKQLKEIIPVHFGEKEGNYYAFHKSGNLAVVGEYHFDDKIGLWREYHDARNRRKREIVYSKDPFDDEFRPYISREWDKRGKLIYQKKSD